MKPVLICLILSTALAGCQSGKGDNQNWSVYGASIDIDSPVDAAKLPEMLGDKDSVTLQLKGEIIQTCQMKGCWMSVGLGSSETMRVTFKDYGFFVPKSGMEHRETIVKGTAKWVETDVETLRHLARDGGATAEELASITEPRRELTFVASGVAIKQTQ